MKQLVPLSQIDIEHSPVVRGEILSDTVAEYCEGYEAKNLFPPLHLFKLDGGSLLLADGRHRYEAALQAGKTSLVCDVSSGSLEDCVKAALKANRAHGLRRSAADKHACVLLALQQFPQLSSREIAAMVGVSHPMVESARKAKPGPSKRMGKDGKERSQPGRKRVDGMGFPLPETVMPLFERDDEVAELLRSLKQVKTTIERAHETQDMLYAEVNAASVCSDLASAISSIRTARPFAVCPSCQGKLSDRCTLCNGRGAISEFRWKNVVPEELKLLRERTINAVKKIPAGGQ